jgi:hypothetical protein
MHCLFWLSAGSGSALRQLRDRAHARVGHSGAPVVRTAVDWLDAKSGDGCCADGAVLCIDLAELVCRAAGNCWLLSAGCWRRVHTGSCKTSGQRKRGRDSTCTVDLHRSAHSAAPVENF